MRLAQMRGADRIALGLVEELLIECGTGRRGARRSVGRVTPREFGADATPGENAQIRSVTRMYTPSGCQSVLA